MESKPLVSVIIPTYKRSDSLCRTIDSVLAQTYPNIEIIVVDDNGIGNEYQLQTEARLKDYITSGKITYLKHEVNRNGSAARNTGFRASKGEYINFLDDDDVFMPEKIERQVARLEGTSEEWGACYCNSRLLFHTRFTGRIKKFDTDYKSEGILAKEYLTSAMHFNTSSILFKRQAVIALNGFDEEFRRHQDFELMLRFFTKFKIVIAPNEPLLLFDMLNERINSPNLDTLIEIKQIFLKKFETELKCLNIWNDVNHAWRVSCGIEAIDRKRFSMARDLIFESTKYKKLTSVEKIDIVKGIIRSLLK